ncbi:MAG: RecQ family ATP-dependent DNA helicase [Gloeomargaritaceae cyanobacterium C42_A2020_066]|nr:RecQ family ATP-dependent DNA helicase [Gloeomargaritaceae cyanobacterium C42_A2020_066]
MSIEQDWERVRQTFQRLWGYTDFRSPQGEVIRGLLEQRDSLIVLPTGIGKSLCFQLPALVQSGTSLVISPLIALMTNQVQELQQRRLPAATLHSQQTPSERRRVLLALEQGRLRLLYLAPETLFSPPVWERLLNPALSIRGLILDEAHTLAQWGDSFRPAYERLGAVRPALLRSRPHNSQFPIAAFTATADPTTQAVVQRVLDLRQPQRVVHSPYRANLFLETRVVWTPAGRRQHLRRFLESHRREAGLLYVTQRRQTEEIATWLQQQGWATAAYHAGLAAQERRRLEQAWITGDLPFLVSTSALGMGVNKPDTRWVVHYHPPANLLDYIQGIGRGGRDGRPAHALLLHSEPTGLLDPSEAQSRRHLRQQLQAQFRLAHTWLPQLPQEAKLTAVQPLHPQIEAILALLHRQGHLLWLDPFTYRLQGSRTLTALPIEMPQDIQPYLRTRHCRWAFLIQSFTQTQASTPFRCGHCDNCCR